jgi:hypothetical protein
MTKNISHRILWFKDTAAVQNCELITDEDIYGGDTQAEIKYNIENDSSKYGSRYLSGHKWLF